MHTERPWRPARSPSRATHGSVRVWQGAQTTHVPGFRGSCRPTSDVRRDELCNRPRLTSLAARFVLRRPAPVFSALPRLCPTPQGRVRVPKCDGSHLGALPKRETPRLRSRSCSTGPRDCGPPYVAKASSPAHRPAAHGQAAVNHPHLNRSYVPPHALLGRSSAQERKEGSDPGGVLPGASRTNVGSQTRSVCWRVRSGWLKRPSSRCGRRPPGFRPRPLPPRD